MAKITESFEKVMDYSNDDTQIEQLSLNTQQSVFSHCRMTVLVLSKNELAWGFRAKRESYQRELNVTPGISAAY